jgi:hypothetical protein
MFSSDDEDDTTPQKDDSQSDFVSRLLDITHMMDDLYRLSFLVRDYQSKQETDESHVTTAEHQKTARSNCNNDERLPRPPHVTQHQYGSKSRGIVRTTASKAPYRSDSSAYATSQLIQSQFARHSAGEHRSSLDNSSERATHQLQQNILRTTERTSSISVPWQPGAALGEISSTTQRQIRSSSEIDDNSHVLPPCR